MCGHLARKRRGRGEGEVTMCVKVCMYGAELAYCRRIGVAQQSAARGWGRDGEEGVGR